jgi:hypothetical protein
VLGVACWVFFFGGGGICWVDWLELRVMVWTVKEVEILFIFLSSPSSVLL